MGRAGEAADRRIRFSGMRSHWGQAGLRLEEVILQQEETGQIAVLLQLRVQ